MADRIENGRDRSLHVGAKHKKGGAGHKTRSALETNAYIVIVQPNSSFSRPYWMPVSLSYN